MILNWRPGRYARDSGKTFAWLCVRAAAQATMVVLLARSLGASRYGELVSLLAVASFMSPLAGLGLASVILRDGARSPERLAAMVRDARRLWLLSASGCAILAIGVAHQLLPPGLPWIVAAMVISVEVGSVSLSELIARSAQAQRRLGAYGAVTAGLPLARIAVLLPYVLLLDATLTGCLWLYAGSSAAYMIALGKTFPSAVSHEPSRLQWRDGMPFSANALAVRIQAEFNKPVLARQDFALAGGYNAAQRALDIVVLPLLALQEALWPRLYAKAEPSRDLTVLGGFILVLAALAGIGLVAASPVLPLVLGAGFETSASTLALIAWLPLAQSARSLLNFQVIRQGRTMLLAWAGAAGALASIVLVAVLVPRKGITGAAQAAYAAEAVIATVLALGSLQRRRAGS